MGLTSLPWMATHRSLVRHAGCEQLSSCKWVKGQRERSGVKGKGQGLKVKDKGECKLETHFYISRQCYQHVAIGTT